MPDWQLVMTKTNHSILGDMVIALCIGFDLPMSYLPAV